MASGHLGAARSVRQIDDGARILSGLRGYSHPVSVAAEGRRIPRTEGVSIRGVENKRMRTALEERFSLWIDVARVSSSLQMTVQSNSACFANREIAGMGNKKRGANVS